MLNNPSDAAIVRAIVQTVRSLSLKTIAEGVENENMPEPLRMHQCDEVQGYHFAWPMPAGEFLFYLSDAMSFLDTHTQLLELYTRLANEPAAEFGWASGRENARALGYAEEWLNHLPECVWESAAAVGNPFSLGPIHAGETVVDVGCGAGADACVAALLVGKNGEVFGIDSTPAMVDKATRNTAASGLTQVTFQAADMRTLPLPDACANVVISNGAINLAENKNTVLEEIFRILQPGGRLQLADMIRDPSAAISAGCGGKESWADCVSGTLLPEVFLAMISKAGFINAELTGFTAYRTSPSTIGAMFRAVKPY